MARIALTVKNNNKNNNKTARFDYLLIALVRFYDFTYLLGKY